MRPIEFMSRTLRANELNWHTSEKECFAIYASIKKWTKFLVGREFTVLSDHKNLEVMMENLNHIGNARIHRWTLYLKTEHRFVVRHVRGSDNIPADYLSRNIDDPNPLSSHFGDALIMTRSMYEKNNLKPSSRPATHVDVVPVPVEVKVGIDKILPPLSPAAPADLATVRWDTPFDLTTLRDAQDADASVSYTHLTLPTICSV